MSLGREDLADLYRRQAQSLLLFFQRRVHDPELATDLMADTFAIALRRRKQYRGSSNHELSGWIWSIARSVIHEHERRGEVAQRARRRLGRERRALTDREIERIEELAASEALREAVRLRMAALPEDQREAVRLRVLEEQSYAEVARSLGISVEATRMRVSRTLRQLASELRGVPRADAGPDPDGAER